MKKVTFAILTTIVMGSTTLMGESYPADGPNSYKALHDRQGTSTYNTVNEGGFYLGVAYSFMRDNSEFQIINGVGGSGNVDGNLGTIVAGVNVHENLALEARFNTLIGDVSTSFGDVSTSASNIALFVKPKVKIDRTSLYALLGYGQVKVEDSTDEDFQWGVGASYPLNPQTSIFLDYMNIYNKKQTIGNVIGKDNVHVFTVGVTFRFSNAIGW